MPFIDLNLETILNHLEKLNAHSKPLWGNMNAQMMVEHLTDLFYISTEKLPVSLLISEQDIDKMLRFLDSDKEMPKLFDAAFVSKNPILRNEEIELAIDELVEAFIYFEEYFEKQNTHKTLHPYYGKLDYEQWKRLHSKHITHHFAQFNLM